MITGGDGDRRDVPNSFLRSGTCGPTNSRFVCPHVSRSDIFVIARFPHVVVMDITRALHSVEIPVALDFRIVYDRVRNLNSSVLPCVPRGEFIL
jgi:hypothetical protein